MKSLVHQFKQIKINKVLLWTFFCSFIARVILSPIGLMGIMRELCFVLMFLCCTIIIATIFKHFFRSSNIILLALLLILFSYSVFGTMFYSGRFVNMLSGNISQVYLFNVRAVESIHVSTHFHIPCGRRYYIIGNDSGGKTYKFKVSNSIYRELESRTVLQVVYFSENNLVFSYK